jgi:hypothetical protein
VPVYAYHMYWYRTSYAASLVMIILSIASLPLSLVYPYPLRGGRVTGRTVGLMQHRQDDRAQSIDTGHWKLETGTWVALGRDCSRAIHYYLTPFTAPGAVSVFWFLRMDGPGTRRIFRCSGDQVGTVSKPTEWDASAFRPNSRCSIAIHGSSIR